ncbi:protein of unknown function DUF1460 [Candidatus Magnetoovum chiemensis]|nr:protein of unknown function DUF1460 [Candidatus Magnetoovum chiemensis]
MAQEPNVEEKIDLGKWSIDDLEHLLLEQSRSLNSIEQRIAFISAQFLCAPYKAHSLIGSENTPEVFVIDLAGVDCFTFIDYVEAMSLSNSFDEFKANLKKIRYKQGIVSFNNRNHFFTDWAVHNSDLLEDRTKLIGADKTISVVKELNRKNDGSSYLQGLEPVHRTITYIPSERLDKAMLNRMRNGDYAGIYTYDDGLDVSHTGIIIKDEANGAVYFRNASSLQKNMKVVDTDLMLYMQNKPGIVIIGHKK